MRLDLNSSAINDPGLMRLPHPRRMEIAGMVPMWEELFAADLEPLKAALLDLDRPLEFVIKGMLQRPQFAAIVEEMGYAPGNTNFGMLEAALTNLRYAYAGGRLFQTRDDLDMRLRQTDIGDQAPCKFLRLPYPVMFLEFGESRSTPLTISHDDSGAHIMEGVYLSEHRLGADTRMLYFLFCGSPMGKRNLLDDVTRSFALPIDREEDPLETALAAMVAHYRGLKYQQRTPEHQVQECVDAIYHTAKVLLYLNSHHPVTETRPEYTELQERLRRVKAGKRAKLERKASRTYDRVVIGPKTTPSSMDASSPHRTVETHWRRGHYRLQAHGPKRVDRKLIWIEPTLIGVDTLAYTASRKAYTIK